MIENIIFNILVGLMSVIGIALLTIGLFLIIWFFHSSPLWITIPAGLYVVGKCLSEG